MTTIYPIILPVPEKEKTLTGREKVKYLSQHARYALCLSAEEKQIHIQPESLLKDEYGVPLPVDGYYWSLTHKPDYVGGVIASERIGMDIEKIRPCSARLFDKVADDHEWGMANEKSSEIFFRYWTSKEAVLKAAGTGIFDLSKCKIAEITDNYHLIISYQSQLWIVEHIYFDNYMASIVKNCFHIEWRILYESGSHQME